MYDLWSSLPSLAQKRVEGIRAGKIGNPLFGRSGKVEGEASTFPTFFMLGLSSRLNKGKYTEKTVLLYYISIFNGATR